MTTTGQTRLRDDRLSGSILVIDDDEKVTHLMAAAQSRAGHQVSRVHGGQEALQRVGQQRYDIVTLDLAMPDMSGMEVLRQLAPPRQVGDVIVVTGCGSKDLEAEARHLGACRFMHKPVALQDLWTAVECVLRDQLVLRETGNPASFIDAHFAAIRAVEEIAARLGVTVRTIEIRMRRETGMSPVAYLQQRRMEAAKALLIRTAKPMKQVSVEVGCRSPQHFSRLFQRLVGITPSQFRKRHRNRWR